MITDVKSLINNLLVLNPDSQIKEDTKMPPKSDADAKVLSTLEIKNIKLPGGFYIDENGNITNKIVETIPYVTIEVETINKPKNIEEYIDKQVEELNEKYPGIVSEKQKEDAKELFSSSTIPLEEQMHEVDLIVQQTTIKYLEGISKKRDIPKLPFLTEERKKQKSQKQTLKMTTVEKEIYRELKSKQVVKPKEEPVKVKKVKPSSKILSSKGFTNIMYVSLIIIVILIVYLIMTY